MLASRAMTDAPLILVVDDDRGIRDLLARALPPQASASPPRAARRAAAHGGRAWLENRAGGGLRAVLLLPAADSSAQRSGPQSMTR